MSPSVGSPAHLQDLNPPQREAVLHHQGPILILAGAGSGKTRVLTRRVTNLIVEHGVRPKQILAVTFTNKATNEMQHRLRKMLGEDSLQPWVATFHSTCLRILRRHAKLLSYSDGFVVYDAQDADNLLKSVMKDLQVDDRQFTPADFRKAIEYAKNSYLLPDQYASEARGYDGMLKAEVYDHYQKALLQSNAMDFGDLLVNAAVLFDQHPDILRQYQHQLEHVLVDEFQDTNLIQYRLVKQLTAPQNNILVVGDDDQSIYAFRGATVANILHFEKDFPGTKVVKLEQNYRSTANILESAHGVISKNPHRREKKLWTEADHGPTVDLFCGVDEEDEAHFVVEEIEKARKAGRNYRDIAVFYRTNAQSRALEEALMRKRVPYRIYGGLRFYDRKEVKDILAYLKVLVNEADNQSFLRIINTPPRGIGAQTVKNISVLAVEKGVSFFEASKFLSDRSKGVQQFHQLMGAIRNEAERVSVHDLIGFIVEKSEYAARLEAAADVTAQSRLENLRELQVVALSRSLIIEDDEEIATESAELPLSELRTFLDGVSLTASSELPVEEAQDGSGPDAAPPDVVSLMTLHLAKGLEFPLVFLTGMEEGLLPHYKSSATPTEVAEERRLCYVGMTRAIEKLHLTRARRRMFLAGASFGSIGGPKGASRFAFDIPKGCCEDRGSFFESDFDLRYEDDEEFALDEDQPITRYRSRQRSVRPPAESFITTAENLETLKPDLTAGRPLASPEEMKEGVRVIHPSLGSGVVRGLSGNPEKEPKRFKVNIAFDDVEHPKNIVFEYAKLVLE